MNRSALWACSALLAIGTVVTPAGQSSQTTQEPPTFRGGTTLVSVDVYPRRNGDLVEGLTAADFQVTEDGRPQTITTFELVRFEPDPLDTYRREPSTVAESEREAADPKNRVFVVYLDVYHTRRDHSLEIGRPVVDFLRRTLVPSDLYGVMTPDIPARQLTFRRRTDALERELTDHGDWGVLDQSPWRGRTAAEDRLMMCAAAMFPSNANANIAILQRYREDTLYSSLDDLVRRLGDLREGRKHVMLVSEGWVPIADDPGLVNQLPRPSPPGIGVSRGGKLSIGDPGSATPDTSKCRSDVTRLLSMDFTARFRDLVTDAGRANVSFLAISPSGLSPFGGGGIETLRTLAGESDGYAAVNSNDFGGALDRMRRHVSAYYLLGYVSTNEARDSRFRRIDVKVRQPGIQVSARRGYYAVAPGRREILKTEEVAVAATPAPVVSALGRLGRLDAIDELFAAGRRMSEGLDVTVELPARDFIAGRWSTGAAVTVVARADGQPAITARGRIDAGARALAVVVPLAAGASGPWQVIATASDADRSVDGRATIESDDSDGHLGAPVVFRGAASARSAIQPAAEMRFRRTERLQVRWPAHAAVDDRIARVLDRRGQPLPVPVTLTEPPGADNERTIVADVPLNGLAPGDYVLEIATGVSGRFEQSYVAFRVER